MKIACTLTQKLVEKKIVDAKEYDIYCYGINQLMWYLINFLTVIIIGVFTKNLFFLFSFFVCYIPLRSFAGGIHARTPLACYICSVVALAVVGVAGKYEVSGYVALIVILLCNVVICAIAPVEDENKPLDKTEEIIYKKKTKTIIIAYSIVTLVSKLLNQHFLLKVMLYVSACILVMLLLGNMKNVFRRKVETRD